jgi:hypothetical protein
MKQQIILFLFALCLGMLLIINQVCKQKDSMIRLLMRDNNGIELAQNNDNNIPKNLPIVNIK